MTYYNEFDPFAAQWLRNLYPTATVDEKDIRDVQPADVAGFRRCHFFGGIGGWQYALELAGWPADRPVWSGSCPCQPFSSAGKRKGTADSRHLWPEFLRLIAECKPTTVFGEQVASGDGREWLAGVRADLEALGYAVGAADLCAAGERAPHIRQRLYWVGNADGSRPFAGSSPAKTNGHGSPAIATSGRMGNAGGERLQERVGAGGISESAIEASPWEAFVLAGCSDGRARRISAQPGDEPLAARIPRDLGQRFPELRPLAKGARANRVGRLRGYGNAIVPQVAATFIRAFMETEQVRTA